MRFDRPPRAPRSGSKASRRSTAPSASRRSPSRDIDLEVGAGEFISIMGPSGLRQEHAAERDRPARRADRGPRDAQRRADHVVTRDRALARVRNRELGFIFQTFHLIADLPVVDNVELPLLYRRMSAGERAQRWRSPRSTRWASARACTTSRRSCRAASSSVSPSRGRLSAIRASCSPTSRPATSTRRWATRSWRCSRGCRPTSTRRSSW